MLRSLILGAAIVIGIAVAPHASADNDGFLKALSGDGITATNPSDQQKLVQVGKQICQDLKGGKSVSAEASQLATTFKVSESLASSVVTAAQNQLC
jgi:hypothetical protein